MKHGSAAIIVDTGFSFESLQSARNNILAVIDARTGSVITGFPFISWEHNAEVIDSFAGDPLNHGSMVLSALMNHAPELPVILIRAFDDTGKLIRTTFHDGKIVRPGWTEAYLTAVHICRVLGTATPFTLHGELTRGCPQKFRPLRSRRPRITFGVQPIAVRRKQTIGFSKCFSTARSWAKNLAPILYRIYGTTASK